MSNVLFINLKRNGDIFNTAALAQSYVKEHPHAIPYILVYDEFKKATKPLSVFRGVFTLNRKKITTFCSNDLYSNGFAIDELFSELEEIESISWNKIINYSSDKASTFLANYISASRDVEIKGVSFGPGNTVHYKSNWEIIFNDIITLPHLSPVHLTTAYHGIVNVSNWKGNSALKRISKHDETVKNNFNNLRETQSAQGETCSLVGLQLFSSLKEKDWSKEEIESLLEGILDDPSLYPILLIAPNDEERSFSREINKSFDNKLIIVESDFLALSSVLNGLDVLITPDTSVKHLADLNQCKTIEYSNNLKLSLKHGTTPTGNLIVLARENTSKILIDCAKFLIRPTEHSLEKILEDDVYITYTDSLGWNLKPITGEYSNELFLRQLKRSYISQWCGESYDWDVKNYFSDYNYSTVQSLIDSEKSFVSEVSRDLLGTLRSLVKASESKLEAKNFMVSLDKLLAHSENNHLASIPVIECRALLESLSFTDKRKQLRAVEDLLYKLKKNLQVALECLNTVEKDARSMPILSKGRQTEARA